MLIDFFMTLRDGKVPVTLREFLDLLEALTEHLAFVDFDEFYLLSRTCLVKDERFYDKFDRAFAAYFDGLAELDDLLTTMIPDEWLRKAFERSLSDEEKEKIQSLGGLEKLIEQFKKRLEEQKKRHQGGNRWIGTGGTSPFGAYGYNPEGIRIGQEGSRHKKAAKVWDRREFRNLDDNVEIGTRNIKVALRRLRKFARQGAASELDVKNTISKTAKNGGFLDLQLVPERRNTAKVLLFFDVGGSMDAHIRVCEELFSAARSEFKHMEYFYFHNFIYEAVWQNNFRRMDERIPTWDVIHRFSSDYRLVFVGDASMSPYEITHPGGSVEHWNQEAGYVWFKRLAEHFEKVAWLNPINEQQWSYGESIQMTENLLEGHMYSLTISGLEQAMSYLSQ